MITSILRKTISVYWALCYLLFISVNVYSAETGEYVDTASTASVLINARTKDVWPFLFQMDTWKKYAAKLENIELTGDKEGGMVAVYLNASSDKPEMMIKTLKISLYRRYSFSIYSYAGKYLGVASYNLEAKNGATLLTYDVYWHNAVYLEGFSDQAMLEKKKIEMEVEGQLNQELAVLKAMIE